MAEKYDFLFLFEIKNREFENLCLLKYELENRGYRVKISDSTFNVKYPKKIHAKIVATPWLYHSYGVYYARSYVKKLRKILNLQWEQVFPKSVEESKTSRKVNISGLAKYGCHIAWGDNNFRRLTEKCGIPADQVCKAGQISFDFFRPEFSAYYLSKQEIFQKYNIPLKNELLLFISSFQYAHIPKEMVQKSTKVLDLDAQQLVEIAQTSQHEILNWFESILVADTSRTIIYRPHNSESLSERVLDMAKKYENFKVIRECSIKQWILVSDLILNWFSTSVAEILMAGKESYVLRPVDIPENLESSVVKSTAKFIKNQKDFSNIFVNNRLAIDKSDTHFDEYYYTDPDRASYLIIADYLENMLQRPDHKYPVWKDIILNIGLHNYARKQLKYNFEKFKYHYLSQLATPEKTGIAKSDSASRERWATSFRHDNAITDDDINTVINKIKLCLEK